MSELKNILEEEYLKQLESLDLSMLMEMIEEVLDEVPAAIAEQAPSKLAEPQSEQETIEMVLKMIPDIEVSEIGWSDVRTPDKGSEIKGPQRQLLEGYLSNIKGDDFAARIASVSAFYDKGAGMIEEQSGKDRTKRIRQAISYLVFYKTLTKVITNFNASSAGFSFESFLAALVDGYQIPANTGTIADYVDRASNEEIPVSLKLYRKGGLEVGGSYTDLVNDLVDPKFPGSIDGGMRYVVCTKSLSGEDLDQQGQIAFYQFDFNLKNVFNILEVSKDKSAKCIMLPAEVANALEAGKISGVDISDRLPSAGQIPSPQELEKVFIAALRNIIMQANIPVSEDQFKELVNKLDWSENDNLFKDADPKRFGGVPQGIVRGVSETNPSYRKEIVNALFDKVMPWGNKNSPGRQALITAIGLANREVTNQHSASRKADDRAKEISRMVQDGEFFSPEESARFYRDVLKNDTMRKIALKNSWGYLTRGHFSLSEKQALNTEEPTNTQSLGSINIGREMVAKVVGDIRDILNEEVTEIFKSLKILSDSLNTFFAGGLQDDALANTAVDSATDISSKSVLDRKKDTATATQMSLFEDVE